MQRCQHGILKAFGLPETPNPKRIDDEKKRKIKGKEAFNFLYGFTNTNNVQMLINVGNRIMIMSHTRKF